MKKFHLSVKQVDNWLHSLTVLQDFALSHVGYDIKLLLRLFAILTKREKEMLYFGMLYFLNNTVVLGLFTSSSNNISLICAESNRRNCCQTLLIGALCWGRQLHRILQ